MRRRALAAAALLTVASAAVAGCSSSSHGAPRLTVSGAYVPQPPLADMAAAYFTVTNSGSAADRLVSVTSTMASDVQLMVTDADGSMRGAKELDVPAHGRLALRVGGDHLMLMGLKGRPAVGQRFAFRLAFAESEPVTVRIPVEPASYRPEG